MPGDYSSIYVMLANGIFLCYAFPSTISAAPYWACPGPVKIPVDGLVTFSANSGSNYKLPPVPSQVIEVASTGYIMPKYQVAGVYYAAPGNKNGSRSGVQYGSSFNNGISTSNTKTWNTTETVTLTLDGGLFGLIGTGNTKAVGWTQTNDSTTSVAITSSQQLTTSIQGPTATDGLNHDYDVIWVWLNPVVGVAASSTFLSTSNFGYNSLDSLGMDVMPLTVGELKQLAAGISPSAIPSLVGSAGRLARTWNTGTGALQPSNYSAILKSDPFAQNSAFNPAASSGRYDAVGVTVNYVPAPQGGSQICQTYSVSSTSTSTVGQTATDSNSVSTEVSGNLNLAKLVTGKYAVKGTYTYSNKWGQTANTGSGQTASETICGPAYQDAYAGNSAFTVWKDNVYGTFALY